MSLNKTKTIAAISLVFWLLVILDGFWSWILPEYPLLIASSFSVITISFVMYSNNNLARENNGYMFNAGYAIFLIYTVFHYLFFERYEGMLVALTRIFPLVFILQWESKIVYKSYEIFRKIMLFFAFGAIFLFFLVQTGLIDYFPYLEIEDTGRDYYLNRGDIFRVYGFGNMMLRAQVESLNELLPRALGPFHEGGHFAIYLIIILTIDRMLGKKTNPIFVICGFLTFSMAFIAGYVVLEIWDRKLKKKLNIFPLFVALSVIVVASTFLSSEFKEQIFYLFFERNFASVLESISSSGSLTSGLDERIGGGALHAYSTFMNSDEVLMGTSKAFDDLILSDYRFIILQKGLLGFIITIIMLATLVLASPRKYIFIWAFVVLLVFLHRAWMYNACYIQCMILMGYISYKYITSRKTSS